MMRTTPSRMETIWKSRDIPTAAPVSCIDPRKPITVIFAEFASTSTPFLVISHSSYDHHCGVIGYFWLDIR